ncbi:MULTISPECIES: hypothetical protein [Tenacibaculum]|uniref:hypothetical protein n=1 Tax=Tenacibaculum TaxID=104267 RepID=UPI001F0AF94C|nr:MULTISPECIES: hypothetical protein [Tenacibaculum]MCH3883316.1 hypothetical protein [Tenacibaculum aquimarinum]MDO6601071.1 hypothetical protein [Tenacibaculum sp. 1_MG-2023]
MIRVVKLIGLIFGIIISVSGVTYTKSSVENLSTKTNCAAILEVIGNKAKKSVSHGNVSYELFLTNTSNKPSIYSINVDEDTEICLKSIKDSNSFHSKNVSPFKLSSVITFNNKPVKELNLLPGEKKLIKVTFTVPEGNVKNYWKCSKVSVLSKECNSIITSISLKTYIPDPELK